MTAAEVAHVDPEPRIFAELQWEYRFGDRHTAMTALVCRADPAEILGALNGALLTDEEMASPQDWIRYEDPFGDWHEDPCDEVSGAAEEVSSEDGRRGR
jgi:hypothetical protein